MAETNLSTLPSPSYRKSFTDSVAMTADVPTVHLDVADGIATIRIDNPSKRNCLGPAMWDRLYDIATDAAGDPAVRVAVIRGVGDKAFSAGISFDAITVGPDYRATYEIVESYMNRATGALDALQVQAMEEKQVLSTTVPVWPKIQLSVIHQFRNVRGGKRFGTKTRNVIKVLGHNIVNIDRKSKSL